MNIMYYDGGDLAKRDRVDMVLRSFSIPYGMIGSQEGSETIAALMGLEPKLHQEQIPLPEIDLMIFHEVEDEDISAISNALKQQDAHVERKCVVTKHNRTWKLADLLQEIMEEHAYFQVYEACKALIMEVSSMKEENYTTSSWQAYQRAFMNGLMLLQEGQPPKQQLEQAVQEIQKAKQNLCLKD